MRAMGDFLRECNSGDLKVDPKSFRDTWCTRCSQKGCDLAGFAKSDPMAVRNATWRERFFNTPEADLTLPKFAQIARLDFPNLLQKAMKLEISERRGDWSVPEIPVLDGVIQPASRDMTGHVDDAVQKLAGKFNRVTQDPSPPVPDEPEEDEDDEPEEDDEDLEKEPEPAPQPLAHIPKKVPPQPAGRNTSDPGEVMIGGGAAPAGLDQRGRPAPEKDPWAPPPKAAVTIVKAGAKIQFGAEGKGRVVDGN